MEGAWWGHGASIPHAGCMPLPNFIGLSHVGAPPVTIQGKHRSANHQASADPFSTSGANPQAGPSKITPGALQYNTHGNCLRNISKLRFSLFRCWRNRRHLENIQDRLSLVTHPGPQCQCWETQAPTIRKTILFCRVRCTGWGNSLVNIEQKAFTSSAFYVANTGTLETVTESNRLRKGSRYRLRAGLAYTVKMQAVHPTVSQEREPEGER
jgi:hypothetical protein